MRADNAPNLFLTGPPGVGKTTLGQAAAEKLRLGFRELVLVPGEDEVASRNQLRTLLAEPHTGLIELPWELLDQRGAMSDCRSAGSLIGLWVHPDEIRERCGDAAMEFTPTGQGAKPFGRYGTKCQEHRRLARLCHAVIEFGRHETVASATKRLIETVQEQIADLTQSPLQREGLDETAKYWQVDFGAEPEACKLLALAMAHFLTSVRAAGASERTLSGLLSDLQALGMCVFHEDSPRGADVFQHLTGHGWHFKRKFNDSPNAVARFERTSQQFAEFVKSQKVPEC